METFEVLWLWNKETELNPDVILLEQTEERFTVLHITGDGNQLDILQKLWVFAD